MEGRYAGAAPHYIRLGPASTLVAWTGIIYDHTDLRYPLVHFWRRHCRWGRRRVGHEALHNRGLPIQAGGGSGVDQLPDGDCREGAVGALGKRYDGWWSKALGE